MHLDAFGADLTLGIVGAGLMGSGIAQIAATAGVRVLLYDSAPGAAEKAHAHLGETFAMLTGKGKMSDVAAAEALANVNVVADLTALAPCGLVVEAIIERLDAKRDLFRQIEAIVSPDCLLASNTSSLSITEIASACSKPERVAGYHFFSPVPLMRVVEVIAGLRTAPRCCDALAALAERMGHSPIRATDSPGFIINNAGRGLPTEGLRLLEERVANAVTIDTVLREAAGFRMGPFELLDLTGLDISQSAMEAIYQQFYQEPRFRPSPLGRQRLLGNVLGRKTGVGFYRYENGKRVNPEESPLTDDGRPVTVWISNVRSELAEKARAVALACGALLDTNKKPGPSSLCVVLPLGEDATSAAVDEGIPPARTIALDAVFGLEKHRTLMTTPTTTPEWALAARMLFGRDGTRVSCIRDSAGFICQRVVATIVNTGCDIAQRGLALPEDIDKAVHLGLGYPQGPLAMGDGVGSDIILRILEGIHKITRDPRYRPVPWLRRRAMLGLSLLTSDTCGGL